MNSFVVDCLWGDWFDVGNCKGNCYNATQKRKRNKTKEEAHGGKPCQGKDEDEVSCTFPRCQGDYSS